MSRVPIVVVLGATGTGKSKLAVKIAKRFRGEIISADSMQVYDGLNIVTNKITESEREGVPHHLLDVCKPTDRFTVLDFRNRALAIIDDMRKRGKLPIIVGGTTYYVESVLWNTLMETPSEHSNYDSLINDRCRIVNDATKLRVDKWKTYSKATFDSVTEDQILPSQNIKRAAQHQFDDLHFVDDVEVWCRNIVELENVFQDSIRDTVSQLRLDFCHYRRTFYRLPNTQNPPDIPELDSSESMTQPEDGAEITKYWSIDLVVEVEKRLLRQLLFQVLKKFSAFLDEMSKSEECANVNIVANTAYLLPSIWSEENMHRTILGSSDSVVLAQQNDQVVPRYASFDVISNDIGIRDRWRKLLEVCGGQQRFDLEDGQKKETVDKCRNVMSEIQNMVYQVVETRVKRLALLRIIDDENMVDYDTEYLHSELKLVDDRTANTLHPNDRRKIIRALQLFMSTGKTVVQLRKEQQRPLMNPNTSEDNTLDEHGLSLRYPNALVLWLRCDQDVLNERLTRRVDEMLSSGLIDELETFHKRYNLARLNDDREMDYTKGLFQLIGLKEFHSYLMMSAEDRQSNVGLKELRSAIERLRRTNIQYSKSQNRHVLNKFVNVPDYKQIPFVFELDCSDPANEHQQVDMKAFTLVENYLKKETNDWWYPHSPMVRVSADLNRFARGEFFCTHCQRLFTNQLQLSIHNASRAHQKCVYKEKVRKLRDSMSTVDRPNCRRCNSDDDIFVDIPWQEWNLN